MGIDITSYLLGQKSGGGGGGGGGEEELAMWRIGFFGSGGGEPTNSITMTINGYSGKYALITVMHRSDLQTPPSGGVLLDKQTINDLGYPQHISIFKHKIKSDSVSLTFAQVSADRMNGSAWVVDSDFQLGPCDKINWSDYFNNVLSFTTTQQSFLAFNAINSQNQSVHYKAESNEVWINQQHPGFEPPATFNTRAQVRHYSGFIPPGEKTVTLSWWKGTATITANCKAEVYVYAISKA